MNKENLFGIIAFSGFILTVFFRSIIRITLLNDNLIYYCIFLIGFFSFVVSIYKNKHTHQITKHLYLFIPNVLFAAGIVFSLLWLNYLLRCQQNFISEKFPVNNCFLDIEKSADEYSSESIAKSAFVIKYNEQIKNIIWYEQLSFLKMKSVKAIEIKKSKGLFRVDIIEETNLIYE